MNEQQLAAVKQALEALEIVRPMENPEPAVEEAIAALQSIISQDALHKMAEESRTSGLGLDDWDKIGCVNHDCDKCKAVQEPVAWMFEDDEDNGHKTFRQTPPSPEVVAYLAKWNRPAWAPLYATPPAPQPDYAWPTIEDYEEEVGFEVNIAFRSAWAMARTTNDLFKQMGENT
jgi:hypothetical protein